MVPAKINSFRVSQQRNSKYDKNTQLLLLLLDVLANIMACDIDAAHKIVSFHLSVTNCISFIKIKYDFTSFIRLHMKWRQKWTPQTGTGIHMPGP